MPGDARLAAWRVIRAVDERGAYADKALFNELSSAGLYGRDAALCKELAFGAVKMRRPVDALLSTLSSRPLSEIEQPLLNLLRLGAYQLLYTRVPAYAAVDTTVRLAGGLGKGRVSFANAVLRRAAEMDGEAFLASMPPAVRLSCPDWLYDRWLAERGAERTESLVAAMNRPAVLALRVEAGARERIIEELREDGFVVRPGRLPQSILLEGGGDIAASEAWRRGEVSLQGEASMLAAVALEGAAGERLIDMCAAPGGKAGYLAAEVLKPGGELIAVESNPARAGELEKNLRRQGAEGWRVVVADAREAALEPADGVLLDAPCSGLGSLGRKPDLRWRITEGDMVSLAGLQRGLLEAAAGAVIPGGLLVYSTCTISRTENEEAVGGFLAGHPEFQPDPLPDGFRAFGVPAGDAAVQLLPDEHGTDGFFIQRMRRRA